MIDPTLALTEAIRALFARELGAEIGPDDDFFAAGGDSLAAEGVVTALSAHLAQPVEGWMLLDHPTARGLAGALTAA